ncbi:hypothetical protein [Streptomyces sp. NPDC001903]|uniref:hypothetical protein n=1 Tax=Streptomyces sp. NPDC001903 TaxID=3364622 RepID=UPI003676F95A
MANETVNTPIQTKYTQQLAADLATNQAEQATLTARLNQLQAEEKWLVTTLESLPTTAGSEPASPQEAASPASSAVPVGGAVTEVAVPRPRAQKKAGGATSVKKATVKKATVKKAAAKTAQAKETPAAPAKRPTVGKKTAVSAAKETSKAAEPTLGLLLTEILSKQPGEPKKVSEIRTELEAAHPQRTTSDPVIRATLEKLVAKGVLEKDNRQRMVLYTWPAPERASASAPQSKTDEPATEPAEAAEAAPVGA